MELATRLIAVDHAAMAAQHDLEPFYRGDRAALDTLYREYFEVVMRAVGSVLNGADAETVVHEVFLRLIQSEQLRRSFQGGNLGAWLTVVSKNQARDFQRAHRRSAALHEAAQQELEVQAAPDDGQVEAAELIAAFQREHVPPKWLGVFQARFLEQLSQREAAAKLGLSRTTLAYQELRLKLRLEKFLLRGGAR